LKETTCWVERTIQMVNYCLISLALTNFIQVDFDTPWCQPESDVVAELSRRFGCTLEHWYAEQGCNFCGWQLYERGELVDVLWGELEWSSPTDDDELPEVTGPAWIVDKVAHYGG
ncbi:hypothetical protein P4H89_25540, partial [Escherichia coli]